MKRELSIPAWHELAQAGTCLPMRIPINGDSMFPLVRRNRDPVTIVPLEGPLTIGDVVLFADPYTPRYVLHRVWKLEGERALTWGDNCDKPDGWIPLEAIWGRAVLIERGGREIRPSPRRGMILARVWHPAGWLYRRGLEIMIEIWHRLKRIAK